jgi:glutaredoxin
MDGCPGCDTAKNICKKKGIKFSYHLRKDNEETVKKVAPGYKYVPVIVNRFGKFVGGSDKLQEYTKNMPDIN